MSWRDGASDGEESNESEQVGSEESEEDVDAVDAAMAAELHDADILPDVEIDTNLLENLLKSYAAQEVRLLTDLYPLYYLFCTFFKYHYYYHHHRSFAQGLAGPASNILASMHMRLPDDADED